MMTDKINLLHCLSVGGPIVVNIFILLLFYDTLKDFSSYFGHVKHNIILVSDHFWIF